MLAIRKRSTTEICLAAVEQNGNALRYVQDQTTEICLEAVEQSGNALQYVDSKFFLEDGANIMLVPNKNPSQQTMEQPPADSDIPF